MDEEEERHFGDWLRSAAGDCGVAKFYETLVILPPTTKQIRHSTLSDLIRDSDGISELPQICTADFIR